MARPSAGLLAAASASSLMTSGSSTPSTYSPARTFSSSLSLGIIADAAPQPKKPAPDPALHAAQRRLQPGRDLGMGKPVDEGERDAAPLVLLQLAHAAPQCILHQRLVHLRLDIGTVGAVASRRVVRKDFPAELADRDRKST